MLHLSGSFNRAQCLLIKFKNCRHYNVRKFLHKSKLRGSDENLRSTENRKSGKKVCFKDGCVSSAKTRYDNDKIKISKLYVSLQSAIMESVMERCSKAERTFHRHFKSNENVDNIGDIIRKRLDVQPVAHLDNIKKYDFLKSGQLDEVKKNTKIIMKSNNQKVGHCNDDDEVEINMRFMNKKIERRKGINSNLLHNSKRMISAMTHSQSVNFSDKLSKLDCRNYYKWNRKFPQEMESEDSKTLNNEEARGNIKYGTQSEVNKSRSVEKSIDEKIPPSPAESSKFDSIAGKDVLLKNCDYSISCMSSLKTSESIKQFEDELAVNRISAEKECDNMQSCVDLKNSTVDNLCGENDEVVTNLNSEVICPGDGTCHASSCDKECPTTSEINIEQIDGINSFEKSTDVTEKHFEYEDKEHTFKSDLNQTDMKVDDIHEQKIADNIHEDSTCKMELSNDNTKNNTEKDHQSTESESVVSDPVNSSTNDEYDMRNKLLGESSSKHLLDLIKLMLGSKTQFSNVKKQLEMFGLFEEAEKVELFSKAINESLEQTMFDDVTSYLLGLQRRLLTYYSDGAVDQTGISSATTSDNVISVLDKYLNKSEINEISEHLRSCNENAAFFDIDSPQNENNDNVSKEENSKKLADVEELLNVDRLLNSNSIKIINDNFNNSDDTDTYYNEGDFTKESEIGGLKFKPLINNNEDSLSNEENKLEDESDVALLGTSEIDPIANHQSENNDSSKHMNNVVGDSLPSIMKSFFDTNSHSKGNEEYNEDNVNSDCEQSNTSKESPSKLRQIELSLKPSEESGLNSADDKSGSGEPTERDKNCLRKLFDSDPGKASKLINKKNLKAKTFLHPNYWKTYVSSYHTNSIPWVIGKKCFRETTEVSGESQNDGMKPSELSMSDSQIHDYGHKGVKLHGMPKVYRKSANEKQIMRGFNTLSKTQNLSCRNGSYKLKTLDDTVGSGMDNMSFKRNYSTEDYQDIDVATAEDRRKKQLSVKELFPQKKKASGNGGYKLKLLDGTVGSGMDNVSFKRNYSSEDYIDIEIATPEERRKKQLSVKELFPEKKKNLDAFEIDESIKTEDIKLEVIGKKILPKEVIIEADEEISPTNSNLEKFISDKESSKDQTKIEVKIDESLKISSESEITESTPISDKSESVSKGKTFDEETEEKILDGFGLSTSKKIENSEETSFTEKPPLKGAQSKPLDEAN